VTPVTSGQVVIPKLKAPQKRGQMGDIKLRNESGLYGEAFESAAQQSGDTY